MAMTFQASAFSNSVKSPAVKPLIAMEAAVRPHFQKERNQALGAGPV